MKMKSGAEIPSVDNILSAKTVFFDRSMQELLFGFCQNLSELNLLKEIRWQHYIQPI